ncbi:hypothetical protein D3C87_88050 [compost metagenome]
MKTHILSICITLVSFSAGASVSLSADSETINSKAYSIETDYVQSMQWEREGYGSTLKLREDRKVGAGVAVGGQLGMAGVNIEFNIEDADGVVAGFGTGPGYNSFQLAWKHTFTGDYLAPYTTAGYSRWYNSRGRTSDFSESPILDRVLTDAEKKDGRFGTDFLFGSLGLQYNQLSGPLSGVSFYAEVIMMAEAKRSILVPTGAVGTTYYF